eukprot:scaffold285230_cov35-Attheya_sp.AAC.1
MSANKDHILCSKHKSNNIMKNSDVGKLSAEFLKDMNSLIYQDMSANELDHNFLASIEKYREYPKALGYIKRMENQKKKVCRALTKSIFTFGNTSTQRGEGTA